MPKHLVLGGVVMTTPGEVLEHYTPPTHKVPSAVWKRIRPLAVECVGKGKYQSVHGVHFALRIVARFLAWGLDQGIPLDAETIFQPERIEQFIAERESHSAKHSQANYRAALTGVGRACTKRAPFAPEPTRYADHVRVSAPYTEAELAGYWEAVDHQSTEHRSHVLRCILLLGHGAGLRVSEMLRVTAADVFLLRSAPIASIKTEGRIAPVLGQYTEPLREVCAARPEGPLIGTTKATAKDPLGQLRKGIVIPDYLPTLTASRLRTTWLLHILNNGASLHEAMSLSGVKSAATLEAIAPYTKARWADDEYLIVASGVRLP
ncbi:hypothetical protein [Kocuria marina]|uniref:hypothetical protein n=1 Tax=Kocuria marina TaxID=223184 RepID=UPI0021A6B979|nr:hypothetical protein [Kocuria marina]MCT1616439.1 hypothetical protein [Kocuria marina]